MTICGLSKGRYTFQIGQLNTFPIFQQQYVYPQFTEGYAWTAGKKPVRYDNTSNCITFQTGDCSFWQAQLFGMIGLVIIFIWTDDHSLHSGTEIKLLAVLQTGKLINSISICINCKEQNSSVCELFGRLCFCAYNT